MYSFLYLAFCQEFGSDFLLSDSFNFFVPTFQSSRVMRRISYEHKSQASFTGDFVPDVSP